MSAFAAAVTHTWRVGKKYRCTITIPKVEPGAVVNASCEWEPHMPQTMTKREKRDYLAGRDHAVSMLSAACYAGWSRS